MIAIDFGTTNSSVAIASEGDPGPRILQVEYGDPDSYDSNVLPSVVCECQTLACRDQRDTYGHEALRHGFELQHNSTLLQEMKLYFDRSTIDPPTLVESKIITALREEGGVLNPMTKVQRFAHYKGEVPLRPEEFVPATAKLVAHIMDRGKATRADRNEIAIGFPASFHAKGVRYLREAVKRGAFAGAGDYDRIFLYLEPIAAARAYMKIAKGNTLVLDYGGGTLDIAVITVEDPQKLHESSPRISGFPEAGSKMDEAIVDYCLSKDHKIQKWFDDQPLRAKLRFRSAVEKAKIALSKQREVSIDLPGSGLASIVLSAPDIAFALQPIMTRMVAKITQTVADAVGSIDKINFVVMSGGTSLNKVVQTSIVAMFNHLSEKEFVLPDVNDAESVRTCLCAIAKGLALLRSDGYPSVNLPQE